MEADYHFLDEHEAMDTLDAMYNAGAELSFDPSDESFSSSRHIGSLFEQTWGEIELLPVAPFEGGRAC
jgi:hypothetical protein